MIAPAFSQLDPPKPTKLNLPKKHLEKLKAFDHENSLKMLRQFQTTFSDHKSFWTDVAVLDRLHYKNVNQHRLFQRFRRTMELRRLLKRFKALTIGQVLAELYTSFWGTTTLKQCEGGWKHVPSKEFCEYTMHRLIAAVLLLDKLQVILIEVYRDHTTLLRLEHFVSLALVYMGLCSRLFSLAHRWAKQIEDCYDMLQKWHTVLPSAYQPEERATFLKTSNQLCTPITLKKARKKYATQTHRHRRSKKEPINIASFIINEPLISPQKTIIETVKSIAKAKGIETRMTEVDLGEIVDRTVMLDEDMGETIQRTN